MNRFFNRFSESSPFSSSRALPSSSIASKMTRVFSSSASSPPSLFYSLCRQLGMEPWQMLFFVIVSSIAILLERLFAPSSSSWVPLFLIIRFSLKYEQQRRKLLVETMDRRRKWHIQNTQALSPLEPCEWLNKLIMNTWPNYMEPKLSHKFADLMMKTMKRKKPKFIENIELEEFSLGLAPPTIGLKCTYWMKEGEEEILHTGFHWNSNAMNIVLVITVAGIRVNVVISNLQVHGDLRIIPILNGKCVLYSFESPPEVQIGVTFSAMEIPGIALLLERMLLRSLVKMMVEPHRSCFSFPAVSLNKRVSGGKICVTIMSGRNLAEVNSNEELEPNDRSICVAVTLENVTRKTKFSDGGISPRWDEMFEMMVDGSTGSIYLNVYEKESKNPVLQSLGQCKIKVKYIEDDSTVFWCTGRNNSSIAFLAEHPGKEIEMNVPLTGSDRAEITMKLVMSQWHFVDDAMVPPLHSILGSLSTFQESTGRVMKITVEEGRNLAARDRSGKSDPYVLLQYGKTVRRTKTIPQSLDPCWNQTFEFAEISGEEYLKLKCYDADMLIDDSLGSARVNVEGLEDDESRDIWVPLANMDVGEIRLIIKMIRSANDDPEASNTRHGMLELVLIEAQDLIAADLCGTSDPFVSVRYGKQRKRTKVIHRTLNPQWNQTLQFLEDSSQTLELHVKDHNALLPTSSIGNCVVEYKSLPQNETRDFWIPLTGVKKGRVHVRVTRRFQTEMSVPPDDNKECMPANGVMASISSTISSLAEARQLAEEGDMMQLREKIAEIEFAGNEQDRRISQVLKEKAMLLSKINELGRALESWKQPLQKAGGDITDSVG